MNQTSSLHHNRITHYYPNISQAIRSHVREDVAPVAPNLVHPSGSSSHILFGAKADAAVDDVTLLLKFVMMLN